MMPPLADSSRIRKQALPTRDSPRTKSSALEFYPTVVVLNCVRNLLTPILPFYLSEGPVVTSTAERRKGRGCHQNFYTQFIHFI